MTSCALCGRPIALAADAWRLLPGARYEHLACPVSEEMAALPPPPDTPPHPASGRVAAERGREGFPAYLTLDETAQLLRVSKATLRRRIRAGSLPAVRLKAGQTVLIEKQHALALLEPCAPPLPPDLPS